MYAVLAESVVTGKQEIAIRLALGAPRIGLVRLMVSKTVMSALLGEAVGLCAAVLIYHRISDLLYRVAPYNLLLLVLALAFVFAVSLSASVWPTWSAVNRESIDI
jgi:ABC-type antimicrobial peptide transport system permease subunit